MLRSIITCHSEVVSGVTWTRTTDVVLPLMLEQGIVQPYDMPPRGGPIIP